MPVKEHVERLESVYVKMECNTTCPPPPTRKEAGAGEMAALTATVRNAETDSTGTANDGTESPTGTEGGGAEDSTGTADSGTTFSMETADGDTAEPAGTTDGGGPKSRAKRSPTARKVRMQNDTADEEKKQQRSAYPKCKIQF